MEIFSHLVYRNPKDFVSLYYLGAALIKTELQDSGQACLSQSVAVNPEYFPSLVVLANAYTGKKQYTPALALYHKALEIRPHDKGLLIKNGECLRKSGAFNEAIECFKTVIAMDSINDQVHAQMGLSYYSLGKYDSAAGCRLR